ncbi:succinate dehydrogenase, cytochrome b556 subunit [Pseudomonas syringae group genomosp. 3]|uniref:Succinate dehydrogenase cytochrome b556 subunit n=1 Tax=Pseudomonas syringae pv. primulae TaxID=251707 RepID=A0A3M3XDW3_9PSED|nr:succinate dehydrogenase, cytochrome b556 subunit [Pseudomonas syringae group genomosp. 3]RMO67473.1 Succinate dehydrogenase, cytochrome subunit [Pseudomonas syringae pv. primulae]RMU36799.1 Succinate dehydrogenase, cytochrome subunit [Pseudomonas syringae pv. primulae]
MNKKRPVNLDLGTFKYPITSVTSILHRISGIILFPCVFLMLYALGKSLNSEEGFSEVKTMLSTPFAKIVVWLVVSALAYHLVAGVRHLIMDMGVGETLEGGKRGSLIVLVFSGVLMAVTGLWLWG